MYYCNACVIWFIFISCLAVRVHLCHFSTHIRFTYLVGTFLLHMLYIFLNNNIYWFTHGLGIVDTACELEILTD
jgi:hypothetical protein